MLNFIEPRVKKPKRVGCIFYSMDFRTDLVFAENFRKCIASGMKAGYRTVDEQGGRSVFINITYRRSFNPDFRILKKCKTKPPCTG